MVMCKNCKHELEGKYEPKSFEEEIYENWEENGYFKPSGDKTKESYLNDLNVYLEFLSNRHIHDVERISSDDIKDFLKERNQEETTTIAHNLTVIKNFHTYLLKQNIVKTNVSEFIERPKLRKSLPKTLSIEDIDKLLDIELITEFDYRNKAMLELMYGTGLRVSEIVNLTVNDIDMFVGMFYQLVNYEEEGTKIKPNIIITNNINAVVKNIPNSQKITFYEDEDTSNFRAHIKALMCFCIRGWYIYLNFSETSVEYGIIKSL